MLFDDQRTVAGVVPVLFSFWEAQGQRLPREVFVASGRVWTWVVVQDEVDGRLPGHLHGPTWIIQRLPWSTGEASNATGGNWRRFSWWQVWYTVWVVPPNGVWCTSAALRRGKWGSALPDIISHFSSTPKTVVVGDVSARAPVQCEETRSFGVLLVVVLPSHGFGLHPRPGPLLSHDCNGRSAEKYASILYIEWDFTPSWAGPSLPKLMAN